MGTVVVLAILAGVVALIVRKMIKDKKNGKSIQCGGDCSHCGGHCGTRARNKEGTRNGYI